MKRLVLSGMDQGTRWCYRMVGLSILITFGIFMLLPIAEMIHKRGKRYDVRTVETRDILKPPPVIPPRVKKQNERPKPKLPQMQKKINPMMIQAALQLAPGFGDFNLQFGLQNQLTGDALVFELSEVEEPPEPIRKINPIYPAKARLKKLSGRVVLAVVVQADGRVGKIDVKSAKPAGVFESAAIQAISKWRFSPGKRYGKKVGTRVFIPLDFEI